MRIWKYPIEIVDEQTIILPKGAEILHVNMQGEQLCLWAKVNHLISLTEERNIAVIGTGNPMLTRDYFYLGTVFDRVFVWHIFEILDK